jgi:mannose-1-phosphate guanylyltransferase
MGHPETNGTKVRNTVRSGAAEHRWGVILAGGDGTRLQPLTRLACGDNRPKQFCPLLGGKTLLAHTRRRIAKAIDPDHVLFVLTKKHEPFYKRALEAIPGFQKIAQPHNQGTLPAILWSLLHLFHADERALVAFFPSDHYFGNEAAFISTIERSFDFAEKEPDSVILLGAGAERPETEYGWIEPEPVTLSGFGREFPSVRRFWEKPPLETARILFAKGCLWNTFVMIGSAAAFLEMIRNTAPVLFETFESALQHDELEFDERKMQIIYDTIASSDFSREVLAVGTERLLVTSCGEVGWSDLGEPGRFIAALAENGEDNPWALTDMCTKCGLTHEQIATRSVQEKSSPHSINPWRSANALSVAGTQSGRPDPKTIASQEVAIQTDKFSR